MPEPIHYSRRSFRQLPGSSIRIRGQTSLPYNPSRPLRLPGQRRSPRPPQLNPGGILRLLLPVFALVGLGIGVFFGVEALLDDDQPATPAAGTVAAEDPAAVAAGSEGAVEPIAADAPADQSAAEPAAAASEPEAAAAEPARPDIITAADLDGAPVIRERGALRPVPSGLPDRTLADGSAYDPTDPSVAFSSVWAPGTVLELTRLPGAPLLSDEDAAAFVGKTIRVTVRASGVFQEELQLTPAAYELLAKAVEPIIAVRIEVVEAPPR